MGEILQHLKSIAILRPISRKADLGPKVKFTQA